MDTDGGRAGRARCRSGWRVNVCAESMPCHSVLFPPIRHTTAKEKARADTAKRLLDAWYVNAWQSDQATHPHHQPNPHIPPHSTNSTTVRSKGLLQPVPDRRIALLILILDALPFEELWREWIRRQDGRTQVRRRARAGRHFWGPLVESPTTNHRHHHPAPRHPHR